MTDFRKCGMMIDIMETGEKIMNKIAERIARLRALMEERHIDAVLVPTSDYMNQNMWESILPAANILQDLPVLPAQR